MSKHKTIPKKIRLEVYEKYNHHCAYCGCEIAFADMQVDHLNPVYTNTDIHKTMTNEEMYDVENLMPACRQCNFYKSTFSIEEFRKRIRSTLWENMKKEFGYKFALKYGLIEEHDIPITFYFEKRR